MKKPLRQWSGADFLEFAKSVDKFTWIKTVIVGTIFGVLLIFVVWPAWVVRMEMRSRMKTIQSSISASENLSKKQTELTKNKEEYLKYIQDTKNRLYTHDEISFLLGAVSKLAQESHVSIVSSHPREFEGKFPAPFDDQYETKLFDFIVEGKYHDLGEMVGRLELNPKILRIQSFGIKPNETSAEKHIGEFTLSVVSFKKGKA